MNEYPYDIPAAAAYARKYALGRNSAYYDFSQLGGDCTNFVSQCLYAGGGTMNFTAVTGWYYKSSYDRTASWTAARYLYRFLTENKGAGPYGQQQELSRADAGDIIMFTKNGIPYHSVFVTAVKNGECLVCAHSYDSLDRPLSSYSFEAALCVKIIGMRHNA